ncbi:uncharacterized protein HMPREF1120_08770 [Exophiala dermatitidis NIH/UT8656]|uniref:Uncharacterized protein n=1 Tax=Exophiala dermatitidis (strain ATCC 34100 / CBS 525.76 / NIH/UT8656) TaxID=858893 RepID=H6CAM9_EXODN|nr:uncharacterized protein HMPREF1120_08770 [Exophiala dermatitidis NIH/UT8656]EHY60826.1 hypothetical protein HMPREF1120_08770 [Exophiala dermatitidis NIH/UT8656]
MRSPYMIVYCRYLAASLLILRWTFLWSSGQPWEPPLCSLLSLNSFPSQKTFFFLIPLIFSLGLLFVCVVVQNRTNVDDRARLDNSQPGNMHSTTLEFHKI